MESDLEHQSQHFLDHYQPPHHQKPMNSGLMRYQSAPSSLFSSLLDDEFFNRPSSPETERIFAQFLSTDGGDTAADGGSSEDFSGAMLQNSPKKEQEVKLEPPQTPRISPMDAETGFMQQQPLPGNFSSPSQNFYQSQPGLQPDSRSSMEYNIANSMGMDRLPPTKTGSGGNSNLIRHSSSPAGLFSDFQIENGYPTMNNRRLNSSGNPGYGFPNTSWDDSAMIPGSRKRLGEEDRTISSEIKNVDTGSRPPPILAHHLSLPKIPVEMSALDKFMQFQDSVPCKIRAKRGCATHPRSIAERVRRTKISERMRKLQDLVPNMDKQTNTSDMLDLAVEYIKELQTQAKSLSDSQAKCKCAARN